MSVLSTEEIKKATTNFLSKYFDKLECKTYGYEEIVRREGDQDQTIFIVKEGVFSIGKTSTSYIPKTNQILSFCFKSDIIVPVESIIPDFPSLFQIKSIENNLSQSNMIYEISIEQWNSLVGDDKTLKNLPKSVTYEHLHFLISLFTLFRQNRKVENLINQMYEMEHPLLNSGIPHHYLADFYGINVKSFKQIFNKRHSERSN